MSHKTGEPVKCCRRVLIICHYSLISLILSTITVKAIKTQHIEKEKIQ